jgi:hypothetical protein
MYAKPLRTRMSTPTTRSTSSGAGNPTKGRCPAPAQLDHLKPAPRPLPKHRALLPLISPCSSFSPPRSTCSPCEETLISSSIIWDNTGNGGRDKQHHTRTHPYIKQEGTARLAVGTGLKGNLNELTNGVPGDNKKWRRVLDLVRVAWL